jgi:hypothetical protein
MSENASQTYATHRRFVPGYHFVLSALLLLTLIGSLVNLSRAVRSPASAYDASLIVVLVVCAMGLFWYCRIFPLKAQDRAIRAEENLRHFALTGQLLDPRLTIRQIIGLRFADDDELVELAKRAADEGLSEESIKKAIRSWRPDTYRV